MKKRKLELMAVLDLLDLFEGNVELLTEAGVKETKQLMKEQGAIRDEIYERTIQALGAPAREYKATKNEVVESVHPLHIKQVADVVLATIARTLHAEADDIQKQWFKGQRSAVFNMQDYIDSLHVVGNKLTPPLTPPTPAKKPKTKPANPFAKPKKRRK